MPKRKYGSIKRRPSTGRKRRRIYKTKRTYKARARSGRMSVQRGLNQCTLVKLKYTHVFSLNAGLGTEANQDFRMNSLYDPDKTGIGGQPQWYDQWNNLYRKYRVIGSKAVVKFISTTTTTASHNIVSLFLYDNDITPGALTATQIIAKRGYNWRIMGPVGGPMETVKLTKNFSLKQFFNKVDADNEVYEAAVGQNPSRQCILRVSARPLEVSDDPANVRIICSIYYIAKFMEPKTDVVDT